jgi:NAD(P)-dependent dehydrogenase (short-subunit alcohol dehydrogenase family)
VALAEAGAKVVLNGRDGDALAAAVASITAAGGHARPIAFDVADTEAGAAAVAQVVRNEGRLDILINNAGVFGDFADQSFGALRHDKFDMFMRTNARGALKMSEAFVEHLKAGRLKKIIAITSQAGSFGLNSGGLPGQYFYKASKAALNMFMRNLAADLKDHGIIVGILSPGMVLTRPAPERNFPGLIEPPESIAGMIEVIDSLTLEQSGAFIRYTGEVQPW